VKAIEESERVKTAKYIITDNPKELEKFFLEAIENGCEGLVCKSVAEDSVYQARSFPYEFLSFQKFIVF
jgi:DNA ligase-1